LDLLAPLPLHLFFLGTQGLGLIAQAKRLLRTQRF